MSDPLALLLVAAAIVMVAFGIYVTDMLERRS